MNSQLLRNSSLSLALALVPLAACVDAADDVDIAADEQSIINGDGVTDVTIRDRGLAVVNGCSGVVLRNDWVLTAGHCLNASDQTRVTVTFDGQTATSDRLLRFGGYNEERGPDIAAVHLATPFTVNGATTGFARGIAWAPVTALKGASIELFGIGFNTPAGAGYGTWRTGTVTIDHAAGDMLWYFANARGQTAWSGDSGGPSFKGDFLVGIQSGAGYTCAPNSPPGGCTVQSVDGGSQTFVLPVYFGIAAAMERPWVASRATDLFDVSGDEMRAAREVETDFNVAAWAAERRIATELCQNRGFAGGHFIGYQVGGVYGLACSGSSSNQVAFEATTSEIQATGWGYFDADTTGWAHVARAAFGVCRARGYLSGFVDGNQTPTEFSGRTRGVVCLKNINVGQFDATWSELNATGWRVDDVNTVHWAQGQRAAHEWCRARSWTTGFLNGQQGDGKYGVTCQRSRNVITRPRPPIGL